MEALVASLLVGAALLTIASGRQSQKKKPSKGTRWKDRIPGGFADKRKPSDFNRRSLRKGIQVELEHTSDRQLATEIAMDHLTEHPDYYEVLPAAEREMSRRERKRKKRKR